MCQRSYQSYPCMTASPFPLMLYVLRDSANTPIGEIECDTQVDYTVRLSVIEWNDKGSTLRHSQTVKSMAHAINACQTLFNNMGFVDRDAIIA